MSNRQSSIVHTTPAISTARSKLNWAMHGPSVLIRIKQSSVEVFKRFLRSVLMRFIAENARSHSAVLTEMSAPIEASLPVLETYHVIHFHYTKAAHCFGCVTVFH